MALFRRFRKKIREKPTAFQTARTCSLRDTGAMIVRMASKTRTPAGPDRAQMAMADNSPRPSEKKANTPMKNPMKLTMTTNCTAMTISFCSKGHEYVSIWR